MSLARRIVVSPMAKFGAWWLAFFGWFASGASNTCPCCGQPGCPTAPIAAGVIAAVGAIALFLPRWLWRRLGRGNNGHGQLCSCHGEHGSDEQVHSA